MKTKLFIAFSLLFNVLSANHYLSHHFHYQYNASSKVLTITAHLNTDNQAPISTMGIQIYGLTANPISLTMYQVGVSQTTTDSCSIWGGSSTFRYSIYSANYYIGSQPVPITGILIAHQNCCIPNYGNFNSSFSGLNFVSSLRLFPDAFSSSSNGPTDSGPMQVRMSKRALNVNLGMRDLDSLYHRIDTVVQYSIDPLTFVSFQSPYSNNYVLHSAQTFYGNGMLVLGSEGNSGYAKYAWNTIVEEYRNGKLLSITRRVDGAVRLQKSESDNITHSISSTDGNLIALSPYEYLMEIEYGKSPSITLEVNQSPGSSGILGDTNTISSVVLCRNTDFQVSYPQGVFPKSYGGSLKFDLSPSYNSKLGKGVITAAFMDNNCGLNNTYQINIHYRYAKSKIDTIYACAGDLVEVLDSVLPESWNFPVDTSTGKTMVVADTSLMISAMSSGGASFYDIYLHVEPVPSILVSGQFLKSNQPSDTLVEWYIDGLYSGISDSIYTLIDGEYSFKQLMNCEYTSDSIWIYNLFNYNKLYPDSGNITTLSNFQGTYKLELSTNGVDFEIDSLYLLGVKPLSDPLAVSIIAYTQSDTVYGISSMQPGTGILAFELTDAAATLPVNGEFTLELNFLSAVDLNLIWPDNYIATDNQFYSINPDYSIRHSQIDSNGTFAFGNHLLGFALKDRNVQSIDESVKRRGVYMTPNPTNNMLILKSADNEPIESVKVLDLHGRLLKNIEEVNTEIKLELKYLIEGVYFVIAVHGGQTIIEKIVKID